MESATKEETGTEVEEITVEEQLFIDLMQSYARYVDAIGGDWELALQAMKENAELDYP